MTSLTQRALRDRLMSRGKNCLPTVSRQFLTRNYPRPNCLLKCLPNCLSPTREGFLSSFKINPAVRVPNCETGERHNLSRGNFCPATSICLFWPTGHTKLPVNLFSGGAKKNNKLKYIAIFLTALAGQLSQGRTPTRSRDKRDKKAILLCN